MNQDRCRGQTKEGKQCESPFVDKDGYCPAHGPDGTQRMRDRGQKGGDATRRRFSGAGLSADRLGSLETISDAQRWFRLIAQAVGERELSYSEGQSMTSSIREWVKAEDARVASEDLAALKAQIAEVRDGLKGNPKLEVVP